MSDNKKYYWIKLKTNFFEQETIDFLLSQKNGCEYVVLYQMLCLNTANTNGKLCSEIGEMIVPYNVDKIVRDTKYFDTDTVVVALELFKKLGLVYEEENQVLKIVDLEKMVGSETKWAETKRIYREKQKLLPCSKALDNVQDNVRQEYRDKSIEIRDKNINIKNNTYVHNATQNAQVLSLQESWFNTFWNCYPNKKDKKRSKQKFLKACKTEDDFHNIMTGLNNTVVKQAKSEGKDFIPMASTWLNGERWNDPPYTPKQRNNNNTQESWSFMDEDI